MNKLLYLALSIPLLFSTCRSDAPECQPGMEDLNAHISMDVLATFAEEPVVIFQNFVNHNGYDMNFEDVRLYLSDISLVKVGGEEVQLSEIEYFKFIGDPISNTYEIPAGEYQGFIFHVGVPEELNGTDDPDFLTSQYGAESPLNVQNGMYWGWSDGYRFLIYEGRIDGTPDDPLDNPSVFSIHLGKDQFYTQLEVDLPFTVDGGQMRHLDIEWDLAKMQFNDMDSIDLSLPDENQFHGGDLEFAARFQAFLADAFSYEVY